MMYVPESWEYAFNDEFVANQLFAEPIQQIADPATGELFATVYRWNTGQAFVVQGHVGTVVDEREDE